MRPGFRLLLLRGPFRTNFLLLLLGAGLVLFIRQLIREADERAIGFAAVAAWEAALFVLAAAVVVTQPKNRWTWPIILIAGILCRFATMFSEPFLSTDVYRYAWDGVVEHAGISPYRYVPADPALAFLREPNQDLYNNINRRDYAVTIYPPGAQILFYLVTFLVPTMSAMKFVMILFEGLTLWALVKLLGKIGRPPEQALLYALCPLLAWEIGVAGHLDSVAMAYIVLAMGARMERRPGWTGFFLGLATMTKLYPLVLFPALWRRGDWKMPAVMAGMAVAGYASYASVGWKVFGFLTGYAEEEGMNSGERFYLLNFLHTIPGLEWVRVPVYLGLAGCVFAGLAFWCWRTCADPKQDGRETAQTRAFGLPAEASFVVPCVAIALVVNLLFSPRYPWYGAWLVPFLALVPSLTLLTYLCGLFYLCTSDLAVGHGPKQYTMNSILYGMVLGALLIEAAWRWWRVRAPRIAPSGAEAVPFR